MRLMNIDPFEADKVIRINWWLKEDNCDYCIYKSSKTCDYCAYNKKRRFFYPV